jgi:hypothetical protein
MESRCEIHSPTRLPRATKERYDTILVISFVDKYCMYSHAVLSTLNYITEPNKTKFVFLRKKNHLEKEKIPWK